VAQVPATLRDSLVARLDRTGAARETAQWAAVIGREFAYPILRAVVPFPEQRLEDDLTTLLASGLIVARDEAPHRAYAFKHALIQEAAYSSLLKRTRQDYHGRIAQALTNRFPRGEQLPLEILAEHYSRAGLTAQAADHWRQAGERATAQGATLEARTFFDRALAELDPADFEQRWSVLLGREFVLDLREERGAQRADIEALLQIADALADDVRRAQALLRQVRYAYRMTDFQLMLRASEAAATRAARAGNVQLEAQALARTVVALSRLERRETARAIVEKTLALLPAVKDDVVESNVLSGLAVYYGDLGDVAHSLQLRLRGIEIAQRAGDRSLESMHLANVGMSYARLGLYAPARTALEAGLALAQATSDGYWQIIFWFDLCYVLWSSGDRDGGRASGERALQELRRGGYNPMGLATCLFYLGLILEDIEDYHTAAAYLTESRTIYAEGGWPGSRMEVQATEARCLLALGRHREAQQLAVEVWTFMRAHGTATIDFPSRVYLCIADVVARVPTPDITEHEVLEAGYAELMQTAEMIEDSARRRSFLEDELSNRALVARWKNRI
jgi:tetratricopeptide (TPR) repeat protein